MNTKILLAAAMVAFPVGVVATQAVSAGSVSVTDEAKTANINLEVSGMR